MQLPENLKHIYSKTLGNLELILLLNKTVNQYVIIAKTEYNGRIVFIPTEFVFEQDEEDIGVETIDEHYYKWLEAGGEDLLLNNEVISDNNFDQNPNSIDMLRENMKHIAKYAVENMRRN